MLLPASLIGEVIATAHFSEVDGNAVSNIPWLEISMESGRNVEIIPTSNVHAGIEQLGVELREVDDWRLVSRWPGGQRAECVTAQIFKDAIGKQVAFARFETSDDSGVPDMLVLGFWGASSCRIAHDQSLPMSLRVQREASAPPKTSLERRCDR